MKITEERINGNFLTYCKLLQKYGCYSEELITKYGEKIKMAPFSKSEEFGGCYDGGMIDVVVRKLCPIALSVNKDVFGSIAGTNLYVDEKSLVRVLLLMHIGKGEIFVPEIRSWMLKNGNNYMFNDNVEARKMKLGLRSLYMCQECGISLTPDEFLAMTALDREDDSTSVYDTPLANIVRFANASVSMDMAIGIAKEKRQEVEK